MNQKPSALDYISTLTKALLSVICVVAICAAMFYKNYSDPATLSALFLLTGTLIGGLRGTQLAGRPDSVPDGETTMKQTTETVTKPKPPTDAPMVVTRQPEVAIAGESPLDPASKPNDTPPVQT